MSERKGKGKGKDGGGKKVSAIFRMQAPAGRANPAPPVGPILGQRGVNIQEFCRIFNERTSEVDAGAPTPVVVTVYADKTFEMEVRTPTASYLLKKAASLSKGGSLAGREFAGQVTRAACREIGVLKMRDLNALDEEGAMRVVMGTARSMGLEVVD